MGIPEADQNYKIYINDSLMSLRQSDAALVDFDGQNGVVQLRYFGKVKTLLNAIDNLEKSSKRRHISVVADDLEGLFNDFTSLFRWIEAGGGIVENTKGHVLAIYRRKRWDLPKGKLDPGESFEEAAVREVIEETGLSSVESHDLIASTLHVFRNKRNDRSLKLTKWYYMTTEHEQLRLQHDEDIEDAQWGPPEDFLSDKYNMYRSIQEVVRQYLSHKKS